MRDVIAQLKDACKEPTALWFSGGKDSRLLLELMLGHELSFTVLCMDELMTKTQRQAIDAVVKSRRVPIYSYLPSSGYVVGDGQEQVSIIAHYPVGSGGETIPIIRDVIHSDHRCGVTDVSLKFGAALPPMKFTNHIIGAKRRERHYVFGGDVISKPIFTIGDATFLSPLFFWSDRDVLRQLKRMKITLPVTDETDTGNVLACTRCFSPSRPVDCPKNIDPLPMSEWNGLEALTAWRTAFGVNGNE